MFLVTANGAHGAPAIERVLAATAKGDRKAYFAANNGIGSGTANDGLINGGEAGIAGVSVQLTNCAATVLASAVTDGSGNYSLSVPAATAVGASLCVVETNPANYVSTGASAGSTQLPSGSSVSVGGTAYTYTRTGTDRIAFTWNGTATSALNFGDVGLNTFATDGAKNAVPGSTVVYGHSFKAQTGGTVSFDIPSVVDTPAISGWLGKVYADPGCTGTLQAGATLLYPPATPTTVVAGQTLCIVMQEFVPASAQNGYTDNSTVQASFTFTNALPGLSATYTVHDITTVATSALDLKKEVRNVTQAGTFGVNNQAKSGETLEYRITYTNNATTPISGMTINDQVPSFTTFVSALTGTTPSGFTACAKTTPANPSPAPSVSCASAQAAGGTGAIDWKFTGVLNPGDTGTVLFTVKVD